MLTYALQLQLSMRNTGLTDASAKRFAQQLALESCHESLQIDCRKNLACSEQGTTALQGLCKIRRNISVLL